MRKILSAIMLLAFVCATGQRLEVYFEFDRDHITEDAATRINNFVTANDAAVSKIYGYCDWKGSNAYNDSLSMRRVDAVYRFLVSKGVKVRDDYESKGFGEDFDQSPVQSENRKVIIEFERPSAQPETTLTEAIRGLKPGDKVRLKNINFHNNSAVIRTSSQPTLYELLCIMEDNPTLKIEIQGHICCQLREDVNDTSTARARAIYNFLIRNKINRKRLSYKGFGISQPIHPIPEKSEAEADENRRVEVMVVDR